MMYELNGKKVRVPDEIIKKYEESFDLDEAGAIQMYLEEQGILRNEELEELDAKAKKVKINHGATSEEVIERKFKYDKTKEKTQKERVKKPNADKAAIITLLCDALAAADMNIENIKAEKPEKVIKFEMNGKKFTLDLVQNRG